MDEKTHAGAAICFLKLAETADNSFTETGKKEWMIAASQNYFYAGINAIEAMLARGKTPMHPHSHESRSEAMSASSFFTSPEIHLHILVSSSSGSRIKTGYKGVNGENYKKLKEFASYFVDKADIK